MAVTKNDTTFAVKIEYKKAYDTLEEFPTLNDYSQTFTNIKEAATVDQIKAFADALMSLTIYRGAPYKVKLVDTSDLVVE